MFSLIFLILFIAFLIYTWFKKKFTFWDLRGFPYMENPRIPLGNMTKVGFTEHMSDFMRREYNNFKNKGPAFGCYASITPVLIPTDPELLREILVRNFESFHDRGFIYHKEFDPLSSHLFMMAGQEWKDLRAKLSPTFTSGRMKMMFPIVESISDRMVDYLKPFAVTNEVLEIKEVLSSFTTEVIANVAFGMETNCLGHPENDFRKMAKRVIEPTAMENLQMTFLFAFPKLSKYLKLKMVPNDVEKFFLETVKTNLEYREKNNVERNDFFQLVMNIKKNDEDFKFVDLAAQSFVFFVAGFETSSTAGTFMSYELAINQDIQDRLRDEINEVLERHNGEVTYDAIMEMKYFDMVFNETMRKWPGVETHFRSCVREFKIPDTDLTIPTGTLLMIPTYAFHMDERFWDEPEKFDPERFNEENVKNIVPYTYFPFGDGPRICIGERFGRMQTKIGIAKLLMNFKVTLDSKTKLPIKFLPNATVQAVEGGVWVRLEKI